MLDIYKQYKHTHTQNTSQLSKLPFLPVSSAVKYHQLGQVP